MAAIACYDNVVDVLMMSGISGRKTQWRYADGMQSSSGFLQSRFFVWDDKQQSKYLFSIIVCCCL